MPERPRSCPFENRATHRKNRQIRVNGYRPIVYGYCAQAEDCGFCAGTGFKPNLEIQLGREYDYVPCPYCTPDVYKRRVERLKDKLPK